MKFNNIIIVFYSLFLVSCSDKTIEGPEQNPTIGEVVLDTKFEDGNFPAFSFSEGKVIKIPNTQGLVPDITISVHINEGGTPLGVFLGSFDLKPTYFFKYWSSSVDSSQDYFDSLLFISDSLFTDLALPIKDGQVWAVTTHDGKYGKILIKNSLAYIDSSDINNLTPYGEVSFKWEYQPDGTNKF